MKKHVFFAAAMLISLVSMAQTKGEHYVAGAIVANGGTLKTTLTEGSYSYSRKQPLDAAYEISAEYGHFVANNFRVALSLGASLASSPNVEEDWGWRKNRTLAIAINPNVSYYKRLAGNLYYAPEIGFALERGSLRAQTGMLRADVIPLWGWNVYAHLLAIEFRATEKVAIGAVIGTINYGGVKTTEKRYTNSIETAVNQLMFNMNKSSIIIRFYL